MAVDSDNDTCHYAIDLLIVEVCYSFAFYTIISNMPNYLANIHHFSLKSNGLLSAMPHFMSLSAFIGCGLCLLGMAFAGCNSTLVVLLFTVGVGLSGLIYAGYLVAYTEMTPNYMRVS